MKPSNSNTVFDYRALRLLMGMIAFALPFIVTLVSSTTLTSISASYYTEARDIFVGLLFVVSAFLMAYNGHTASEGWASRAASRCSGSICGWPRSAAIDCAAATASWALMVSLSGRKAIVFSPLPLGDWPGVRVSELMSRVPCPQVRMQ